MSRLWLMRGSLDAPGWNTLRADYEADKVDIIHLDPKVWAVVRADEPPKGYDGLEAVIPTDGMYLDPNGSPLYLAEREPVPTPDDVVTVLGDEAKRLLDEIGDATVVLERLGRIY
jgi:hypothetical protein